MTITYKVHDCLVSVTVTYKVNDCLVSVTVTYQYTFTSLITFALGAGGFVGSLLFTTGYFINKRFRCCKKSEPLAISFDNPALWSGA